MNELEYENEHLFLQKGGRGGEVGQDHVSTLQSVDVILYSSKSRGTEVLEVRCYTVEFLCTACQLFFSIVVP